MLRHGVAKDTRAAAPATAGISGRDRFLAHIAKQGRHLQEDFRVRRSRTPGQHHLARTCAGQRQKRDTMPPRRPGIHRQLRQKRDAQPLLDHRNKGRQAGRGKCFIGVERDPRKSRERVALQTMAPLKQQQRRAGQIFRLCLTLGRQRMFLADSQLVSILKQRCPRLHAARL